MLKRVHRMGESPAKRLMDVHLPEPPTATSGWKALMDVSLPEVPMAGSDWRKFLVRHRRSHQTGTCLSGSQRLKFAAELPTAAYCSIASAPMRKAVSSNWSITCVLPDDPSAAVSGRTTLGKITSDFPTSIKHRRLSGRLSGKIGEGKSLIELRTTTGSISLRKEDKRSAGLGKNKA